MKTSQVMLHAGAGFDAALQPLLALQPDLLLVFGALPFFDSPRLADTLGRLFPQACMAGCSTAGEIVQGGVYDGTCTVTAVRFARTPIVAKSTVIEGMADSFAAGARIGKALPHERLSAVLLFAPGVEINGSALLSGLRAQLPVNVTVSGGLAADGGAFRRTLTLGPEGVADNRIVAVGLYEEAIRPDYGSFAGWETFGPARKVTRCEENILYELDGNRALDIYQSYLGEYARLLPASGLLFPFEMLGPNQEGSGVFRTIIGMNEEEGSLTLAGGIDAGGYLKLMHASVDKLVEGAASAARSAAEGKSHAAGCDALALLVSCVGRKLVMGDRVDEEVEAVTEVLGRDTMVTGYYSNGEISTSGFSSDCRLNNQTMSITWLREA